MSEDAQPPSRVVEGAVGVPSGIGGDGAEKAFFDGDADKATDRLF